MVRAFAPKLAKKMDREFLIGRIYEAASLPELWPAVLRQFGSIVATPNALLAIRRSDDWAGYALSPEIEAATTQYFQSDVPRRTEIATRLIAANRAGFVRSGDVFTADEWEADPFRSEWARKWGFNHGIATAIRTLSDETIVFHLQRLEGEAQYSRREMLLLDSFRPHLARAGLLAARLRLQRLRAAAEALAVVGLPAAILDGRGRVMATNTLMQDLKSHMRWLSNDRIGLIDRTADSKLRSASGKLQARQLSSTSSFVSRSADGDVAVCHVIATPGQSRDLFDGASAILIVSPLGPAAIPDAGVLQSLFDLTPAEATVAQWIAEGRSISELAERRRISINTVRTQLRAVTTKLGVQRQAQVASLLARTKTLRT
jgi:DNA-binding CsgD family transcriptional regulator